MPRVDRGAAALEWRRAARGAHVRRGYRFGTGGRPGVGRVLGRVAVFAVTAVVLLWSMRLRMGPELADDGAFFLRYAENMTHGGFWVWNLGQHPVWGASAPLWPLLLTLPLSLGAPALGSVVGTGLALTAASLSALAVMLHRKFGVVTAGAFVVFAALDTGLMYYAGAGLESPLTVALLVLGLWVVLFDPPGWVAGLAAGLLMVDKIDLIPAGCALLVAVWLRDRSFPRAAAGTALVVAACWYAFAWAYFGQPVPNSFLTKAFDQGSQPRSIAWTWMAKYALLTGSRPWASAFGAIAAVRGALVRSPLVVFLGATALFDLAAYTVRSPFEPYDWYAMPALLAIAILAACGVGWLAGRVARAAGKRAWAGVLAATVLLASIGVSSFGAERSETRALLSFSSNQEFDRAQAGRWVAAHTPDDFVVYTLWGNPAAYSRREVIDGSFLNRPYQAGDLIQEYHPDVLILENNPGSTPTAPVFAWDTSGYRIVKLFDRTFRHGMDYFFAVLVRDDDVHLLR